MATSIDGITEEDLEEFVARTFPKLTDDEEAIMEVLTEYEHKPALLPPRPFANTRCDIWPEDLEDAKLYDFDDGDLIIDEDPLEGRTCSGGGEEDNIELGSAKGKEDNTELGSEDITELRSGGDEKDITGLDRFLTSNIHSNLVCIDLSNSYHVEDEGEILNLLKKDMAKLEYLDISYIRFRNPKYPSKQAFANDFWQHVADHAIHRWPNLQTVTAYGYPLKSTSNVRKMAQKLRQINATVRSAKTARSMLKMMPEQTAENSNLCDKWSDLIEPGKTQYTNTLGAQIPIDDEFISVLVPSYLDINVGRIEGEVARSVETIMKNTPLDVSIVIAFPFFVAKSRRSPQYTHEEVDLLVTLCQKAFKLGLDEKYAMQLEFFLTELIKDDQCGEAVAILYNERDNDGHNVFTRHIGSSGNGSCKRLLVSVENCMKRRMVNITGYGYQQQEERGLFIVIEGVDGIGKSTLAQQLVALFNEVKERAVLLSFPQKKSSTGRIIDSYLSGHLPHMNLFELHNLFIANRKEALAEIKASLDAGKVIVCERFWMSGAAYSIARGLGDVNWCMEYEPEEVKRAPDVTVLLDGIDVALKTEREKDDFMKKEYFMRQVAKSFNELFAMTKQPGKYIKIELAERGDIHRDVFDLINKT